jgi:hypothetical protein
MGKYQRYSIAPRLPHELKPIWRGIGCILIVVVPLMAYGLTALLTQPIIATGLVPYQLLGYVQFPVWVFKYKISQTFAAFFGSFNHLWLSIIIFFVLVIILAGIISLTYTWLYQNIGPARYTPVDAPPSKHKAKRYTR